MNQSMDRLWRTGCGLYTKLCLTFDDDSTHVPQAQKTFSLLTIQVLFVCCSKTSLPHTNYHLPPHTHSAIFFFLTINQRPGVVL